MAKQFSDFHFRRKHLKLKSQLKALLGPLGTHYYSVLLPSGNTRGSFKTAKEARAWAKRNIQGSYGVKKYKLTH